MIFVLRWTAFILGLGGLYETGKLAHEGQFRAAFYFLLFDSVVILVFVLSHALVETVLDKFSTRRSGTWWL
ncbi:MAG TPA: hypothetical protein VGN86_18160 [Pyrinomonadaceae bacterium]|jgi:hypothetical protein|nr:hypothetical protein [Pyrinomonadaceae bacterium]